MEDITTGDAIVDGTIRGHHTIDGMADGLALGIVLLTMDGVTDMLVRHSHMVDMGTMVLQMDVLLEFLELQQVQELITVEHDLMQVMDLETMDLREQDPTVEELPLD